MRPPQERENARILNTRGDLPADAAREYADRRVAAEVLQRGVASLAEALGQPMPALTAPDDVTRMDAADSGAAAGAGAAGKAAADDAPQPVFEDQVRRAEEQGGGGGEMMVGGALVVGACCL